MNDFIKLPNLPKERVKTAVVSYRYPEIAEKIQRFGVETIGVTADKGLQSGVSEHADMLCSYLGGGKFLLAKSQSELSGVLMRWGADVCYIDETLGFDYPKDIALNFLLLGGRVFGRPDSLSKKAVDYFKANSIKMVNVKQGYTRCSCAVVNENAVITQDEGIENALKSEGVDVLRISCGGIRLDGYDYGFIGGACGLIDKDRLLFFGDISKHNDCQRIKSFLAKHGCSFECLSGELVDIGGIIPIK